MFFKKNAFSICNGMKTNQINFRADDELYKKMLEYAEVTQRSAPEFARLMIDACIKMVDDPSARIVPPVIQDVIDRRGRVPLHLGSPNTFEKELQEHVTDLTKKIEPDELQARVDKAVEAKLAEKKQSLSGSPASIPAGKRRMKSA